MGRAWCTCVVRGSITQDDRSDLKVAHEQKHNKVRGPHPQPLSMTANPIRTPAAWGAEIVEAGPHASPLSTLNLAWRGDQGVRCFPVRLYTIATELRSMSTPYCNTINVCAYIVARVGVPTMPVVGRPCGACPRPREPSDRPFARTASETATQLAAGLSLPSAPFRAGSLTRRTPCIPG